MRLIDAERLTEAIYDNVPAPYEDASWAKENCLAEIEAAPTVDAVPVVRCGECIYFDPDGHAGPSCAETGAMIWPNEDDYCSRGQRRDQSADVRNMEEGNEHE